MDIDPRDLEPKDRYKLMIGAIVPRPIAFVSTVSPGGRPNLAPYSFFAGVGSNPMTLLFCPVTQADGTDKDTLRNCLPPEEGGTGEFVVNVAAEPYRRAVAASAEPLAYGESEFELTGLTLARSRVVRPPRVAESPLAFECETVQVIRTAPGVPASGNVVIGRVVSVWARDGIVDERFHVDADRLQAIGRMGGLEYCPTDRRFRMPRGRAALVDDGG